MKNENTKTIINAPIVSGGKLFWLFKRVSDIFISLLLLPIMVIIAIFIYFFNSITQSGKVFYFQNRMGLDCNSFVAIKFRTMSEIVSIERKFDDPVELNRITRLGKILRQSRLDELPQIINVLKGEMSLIGPRPDYYEHAVIFLEKIEEYRWRYNIKPGISGLAQIRQGYTQGLDATRKKVNIDIYYIENVGFWLETKILLNTIITVFKRIGK
ncbi:MAG: sugar transferase [Amylibacter sp.]